jgi:AraC family transcriptional regulator of adaptative response / DNA-3-methyladenine glycosylase II
MGISDRHLRRVIESEFGVSPIELAQTQRLLLAKRLLTDTALPITEVAFASGFSSLRRFNALFKERYRLNPTDLRKARVSATQPETLLCEVAYRPPLDWEALLAFLAARAVRGVEAVNGHRYLRTVAFGKRRGWIAVEPSQKKQALRVELSASLIPAILPTLARVKRLFDLAAEPRQIAAHLGRLAATRPGLRVPGAFDGFELAVRAILGQQISVKAATTLAGRFAAAFGEPIETPFETLTHLSPTAARLAAASPSEIVLLGIVAGRASSVLALAKTVAAGTTVLEPGVDPGATMARLKELPGIGQWTAQYVAMRALAWPDAFPHTDLGIRKALGENNSKRVLQLAEAWRPWRAYATMHLWRSLETAS